jgi:hypothetical protein
LGKKKLFKAKVFLGAVCHPQLISSLSTSEPPISMNLSPCFPNLLFHETFLVLRENSFLFSGSHS